MGTLAAVALAAALPAAALAQTGVADCSRVEASGERTLCHHVVLPASAADVWALWTTSEGLSSWAAPVAAIDARPGGLFESSYNLRTRIGDSNNIRNRVVAVAPQRMLVLQVAYPPANFPHGDEARRLATLIEFEPAGARARACA